MKYALICVIICISFSFWSCSNPQKEVINDISYEYELQPVDTITIELDSISSPFPSSIKYLEDVNKLSTLNQSTRHINTYDIKTGQLTDRLYLAPEGENGIPIGVAGVYAHKVDSIFASNGYNIFLFNNEGRLLKKYKLRDENFSYSFQVFFKTKDQPILLNDTLYCVIYPDLSSLHLSDFKKRGSIFALNINSGKGKIISFYPKSYLEGFFGNNYTYSFLTNISSQREKKLIVSYPIDNEIYSIYQQEKYFAKSKYIEDITPANKIEDDPQGHTSFFVTSPSYGPIYYDKYQKFFIRVAEQPRTKEEFLQKKWSKKKSLIIFNESLKIIGEMKLTNGGLNVYDCFTTPNAFYITLDSREEEQKQFIGFKLIKIQK